MLFVWRHFWTEEDGGLGVSKYSSLAELRQKLEPRTLKWLKFVGLSSREERSTQEKSSEICIGIPLTLLTSKTGMRKVKFHEAEQRTT